MWFECRRQRTASLLDGTEWLSGNAYLYSATQDDRASGHLAIGFRRIV
jgi:hypothetical protein